MGAAIVIVFQGRAPLELWQGVVCASTVGLGALLSVTPFVLEYRTMVRLTEADALLTATEQLKNLEVIGGKISAATSQWQEVQEHSTRTANAAKQIAEQMAAEVAAFTEFMKKANDSERATLRLEVEKLRRAEQDWAQVVMRTLDHVFALNQAAVRAGQPALVEQLGNFQNACRDVARRVGLVPFEVAPGQPFDAGRHRLADGQAAPPPGTPAGDTIASGYTYQGQLLRPALVTLQRADFVAPEKKRQGDKASEERLSEPTLL